MTVRSKTNYYRKPKSLKMQ